MLSRDNRIVRSIFVPTPSSIAVIQGPPRRGFGVGLRDHDPDRPGREGPRHARARAIDQFEGVRGVAIGEDGTIYAVDQYNNRVSAYDRNGNRKWIISTGQRRATRSRVAQSMSPRRASAAPANMQIPGRHDD